MMNNNIINTNIVSDAVDTPLDYRTVVNSIDDIYNIVLPYVGMRVYVKSDQKYYKILSLTSKQISGVLVPNTKVDTYKEDSGTGSNIGSDFSINYFNGNINSPVEVGTTSSVVILSWQYNYSDITSKQ